MILSPSQRVLRDRLRSRHLTRLTGLIPLERIEHTADALFRVAWELGHASGDHEVEQTFEELAEIVLESHGIPA